MHIIGIELQESITAFTDFLLSVLSFFIAYRLTKNHTSSKLSFYWKNFYFLIGIATLLGAINHGFHSSLGGLFKVTWSLMVIITGIAIYYTQAASIEIMQGKPLSKWLKVTASFQILLFGLMSVIFQNYSFVKMSIALGLLFILLTHISAHRQGIKGSLLLVIGIALSFSAVYVHTAKISAGQFNFNDIAHLIMMVCLYSMFVGIKQMINHNVATEGK